MSNTTIVSNETKRSWKSLNEDLEQELRNIQNDATTIRDEDDFRTNFLALSQQFHGDDPAFNKASFDRLHDSVHVFVREIDKAVGLSEPHTLKESFFTSAFAVIQAAVSQEFEFEELEKDYDTLTKHFPKFTFIDLAQYPQNTKVQSILQDIFATYYRTCLELLKDISSGGEAPGLATFYDHAAAIEADYTKLETEWRTQCEIAQRMAQQLISPPGDYPQGDRYVHVNHLGKGSFGEVDVVREITTGAVYARKQIKFNAGGNDPSIIANRVRNEADVMTKLRHNHIAGVQMWFKTDVTWTIIMLPVADYDLTTFLKETVSKVYPRAALDLITAWFGCLASALTYAHGELIKHEDIKPSNILVKSNKVYLSDFGSAKDFGEMEASTTEDYLDQGSPIYWPPERRPWGRAADVFALGCVFSEMLTVRQGKSLREYREFRRNTEGDFQNAFKSSLDKVEAWLTTKLNINSNDPPAQTILNQTLNMLIDNAGERSPVLQVKNELRKHNYTLFCTACQ